MPSYRCYYAQHPAYGQGSQAAVAHYQRTGAWEVMWPEPYGVPGEPPQLFTIARLPETHALVREFDAAIQVERLPRSELDRLTRIIADQGLPHTSMCAGDVVEDVQAGKFYECDLMGWREMQ